MKNSGIGGQAVIEGVMMKNKDQYAVAVRTPENEIVVEKKEYHSFMETHKWAQLPLIRGGVAFAESMSVGIQVLSYSASFYEEDEEQQKTSKVEQAFSNVFKGKTETVIMALTVVLAIILAIGIFMVLPWFVAEQAGKIIENHIVQAVVEGLLRLAIFVAYVFCISLTKDIKRVYMYHGAEHKCINCIENGLELTVENAKKQSREHKRCGTSFLLYVIIISIVFFMFIRVDSAALRVVFRVLLVPVVAGISYEFIKLAGNSNNPVVNILSKPGFWMQALTTREPEDSMIEVAIQSVEAVFDWRAYLAGEDPTVPMEKKDFVTVKCEEEEVILTEKADHTVTTQPAAAKRADRSARRGRYFSESTRHDDKEISPSEGLQTDNVDEVQNTEVDNNSQQSVETVNTDSSESQTEETMETIQKENEGSAVKVATLKKANRVRRPMQPIEELRRDSILVDSQQDDEEDEILSALDKFFE